MKENNHMKDFTTKEMELFDREFKQTGGRRDYIFCCGHDYCERDCAELVANDLKSFILAHDQRFIDEIIGIVKNWVYQYDNYPTMMDSKKAFEKGKLARELEADIITTLQGYKK